MTLVGWKCLRDGALEQRFSLADLDCPLVLAVADGMGGHEGGARASAMVCAAVSALVREMPADVGFPELARAVTTRLREQHRELVVESERRGIERGPGTTFTALVVGRGAAAMVHVGDSRLYRLRDGMLVALSRDHSHRALTRDAAVPGNLLANSIGGGESSFVDCEDLTGRLLVGDRFLLCTDGLSNEVDEAELEVGLSKPDLALAADLLMDEALRAGGRDNISFVLVDVVS